ncbi:phosphatidylcholine/phosphatidylserine synthase [Mesorhizobium sp. YIM 152430]|uniref:CDP-alcohol phosphatidyltransferase family protein n=1 Tax=Mesorhizobium sp. YIM 152430 TaxID=3031761 RepID=UPI0023DB2551|nr:phosphatidylcholine/phosphatidylserine synthase [Mesorhizobium sp. YIM 152430]MDF1600476.1 phosphatidylcholine/phosphatidylserine synthase [Mesorhizobium sp. YIM 152430]
MKGPFAPYDPNGRRRSPRLREIPLRLILPNLVTVLAICAGLSGIRLAFEGRFEIAVAMVLVAAFLDALDGRLARMLKASSSFGAQMDSLADIMNFGVAPALVLYAYVLDSAGAVGWTAALVFAIACCLRLARFNVMLDDPDRPAWQNDYFVGVPAPAGALLVLMPVYLGLIGVPVNQTFGFVSAAFTVGVALLLVSQLPVYSGKSSGMRVRRDLVLPLMLAIVGYVALLFSYTWTTLALTAAAYFAMLPFSVRAYARRAERAVREAQPAQTDDSSGAA